jgi:DNA-binding NarL/FixJ family response regulator
VGQQRAALPLRVLVVHPFHTARAGLALLIDSEADLETLAQTETCEEALASLRRQRRRSRIVVLIALTSAADPNPCHAIRAFRDEFPTIPVLACGRAVDEILVSRALFYGADGFVDYRCAPGEFLNAIRRISIGEFVLEGVAEEGVGVLARGIEQHRDAEQLLTHREVEVLSVASEGLTARQIGRRLGVEERTITTHLGRIYRKLGASGRVAALAAANRYGLVGAGSGV